jgi:hypothetical protein
MPKGPFHVIILVHEADEFERAGYILHELVAIWRHAGVRVTIWKGLDPPPPADLAILHVDLTVVAEAYLALAGRYSRVINGRVSDISKRRISRHLLQRRDDYVGPVIVKTNRNFGGTMEARLAPDGAFGARWVQRLRNRLPWSWRSWLPVDDYRIFESLRQVPRAVWFNSDLVVERFQPERHGDLYCLRSWMFLGDSETSTIAYSHHPVVKSRNIIRREPLTEIPAELRRRRQELGFDFGKFDFVLVDGQPVLFDANRTPSLGRLAREAFRPRAEVLARGLATISA